MFADVEALLIPWLHSTLSVRALTDLPADSPPGSFAAGLPYVQVGLISGSDDLPVLDQSEVDIDCYAEDRGAASALAEQVRHALRRALPGLTLTVPGFTVVVTKVSTINKPRYVYYDNTSVRRNSATYQIWTKARVAAA